MAEKTRKSRLQSASQPSVVDVGFYINNAQSDRKNRETIDFNLPQPEFDENLPNSRSLGVLSFERKLR